MNTRTPPGHIMVHTVRETVSSEGKNESFELSPPKILTVKRAIMVLAGSELITGGSVECILSDELVTIQRTLGDAEDRTVFRGSSEDMKLLISLVQEWTDKPERFFKIIGHA